MTKDGKTSSDRVTNARGIEIRSLGELMELAVSWTGRQSRFRPRPLKRRWLCSCCRYCQCYLLFVLGNLRNAANGNTPANIRVIVLRWCVARHSCVTHLRNLSFKTRKLLDLLLFSFFFFFCLVIYYNNLLFDRETEILIQFITRNTTIHLY